jgi:putative ABC transport system permease protein
LGHVHAYRIVRPWNGLQKGAQKNLGGIVKRSIFIGPGKTSMPYVGLQPGRQVLLRDADIEALEGLPGVLNVAPRLQLGDWRDGGNVAFGAKNGVFSVMGDRPDLLAVEPIHISSGRFLNGRDVAERRKVAVVGPHVRNVLFQDSTPLGQSIMVQGVHFQVIGEVRSAKGGAEGDRVNNTVFVPFSTFQQAFNRRDRVGWFALAIDPDAQVLKVEEEARRALVTRHRVHPRDKQAFWSFNAAEKAAKFEALFRAFAALSGSLGC